MTGRPDTAAPAAIEDWCRRRPAGEGAAEALRSLVADGLLTLPRPGGGATWERWRALAALGRHDLALARLAEGHADALAILAEGGAGAPAGGRLGVWGAGPIGSLTARRHPGGWRLEGRRRWCSGASSLSHAVVTAAEGAAGRLMLVDLGLPGIVPDAGSWPAVGMAGSDTLDVTFTGVELDGGAAVGGRDFYLRRPGFWWGAVGVAAVWWGGAVGVADALLGARCADPHRLAHAGAVAARLWSMRVALEESARLIDDDPGDRRRRGPVLAGMVRQVVEAGATEVVERTGRATGAGPLGHDGDHARRVADLTVYLRQSHAERDLADLGRRVLGAGARPPSWPGGPG